MVVDIEISNDFGMDLVVDIDGDEQQRLMMIAFSYLDSLRGLDFAYFVSSLSFSLVMPSCSK